MKLTEGWRYQKGDNPAWADPRYDDSGWQKLAPKRNYGCAPACWYRLRVDLPQNHAPLAFLLEAYEGATEVYVDGRRAGDLPFLPWWLQREPTEHVLAIPGDNGTVVLAIRIHVPRVSDDYYENTKVKAEIGSPEMAQWAADLNKEDRLLDFVLSGAVNAAIFIAGAGALLLFFGQRGRREYLWLGLYLVLLGSSFAFLSGSQDAILPGIANDLYADTAIYLFVLAQVEFTYAFIGRHPNRVWRVYEGLLLLAPVGAVLCATRTVSTDLYFLFESVVTLPAAIALPFLLLYWRRRGNREARWLIVPSLFPAAGVIITNLPQFAGRMGWDVSWLTRPLYLWGDVRFFAYDAADLIFLLAIGVVMFFRFSRLAGEQARSAAEMSAAREIQRQLVPAALPTVPGCELEAAYLPASEVGGDFYQVLRQPDGSWADPGGRRERQGAEGGDDGGVGDWRAADAGGGDGVAGDAADAAESTDGSSAAGRVHHLPVRLGRGGWKDCVCERRASAAVSERRRSAAGGEFAAGHP